MSTISTWEEAKRIIEAGIRDDEKLFEAWMTLASLSPPLKVRELFHSGQAPQEPHMIWQERFDQAVAAELKERAQLETKKWELAFPEAMLDAVLDKSQPTARRIAAIVELGRIRHRPAILPLLAAMHEEPLANACAHSLIAIRSRRHLRRLVCLLKPSTPDYLKQEAIYCLWMLNDCRGANTLAKIALDHQRESDRTRLMATEALGNNVRKPFIQGVLAEALNDSYIGVRMSALCAVGRCHGLPYRKVLQCALESRLDDSELIYDEPFGTHVRRCLEDHKLSMLAYPE